MLTLSCLRTRARLWRYANNGLNPRDAQQVAAHLRQCTACRREWEQTRATTTLLNAYRTRPLPVSQTNWHDLPDVVPVAPSRVRRRPYVLTAGVAAVFLLALIVFTAFSGGEQFVVWHTSPGRERPVCGAFGQPSCGRETVRTDSEPGMLTVHDPNPGLKPRSGWPVVERPSDATRSHLRDVPAKQPLAFYSAEIYSGEPTPHNDKEWTGKQRKSPLLPRSQNQRRHRFVALPARPRIVNASQRRSKRIPPRPVLLAQHSPAPRSHHEDDVQTVLMDVDGTLRPVRVLPHEQTADATPETIVTRRYVMAQATVPPGKPHLVFRDTSEEID